MANQLDAVLQKALTALQTSSKAHADGLLGLGQAAHVTPGAVENRFEHRMEAFNDQPIAGDFGGQASSGDMLIGDMQLAQTQYPILAQLHRDFLLRRRTRLRATAHGIARMMAHGHERGTLTGPLIEQLKELLKASAPPA